MQTVFDLPQAAPPRKKLFGVGVGAWNTADRVLNFRGFLAFAVCRTNQATHLSHVGPIEKIIQYGRARQRASFQSAAVLLEGFGGLSVFLEFTPNAGGKRPSRRRRLQQYRVVVVVDCP